MAPFPLVKLAIVFFKQVSKPLANQIKARAKNSEFFKKYVSVQTSALYLLFILLEVFIWMPRYFLQ